MNVFKKVQDWGDNHHPAWLNYFRILLGIVLVWKGVAFYLNMNAFNALMREVDLGTAFSISLLAHLIIVLHILGGIAIALGVYTRVFCLVNLPILIGAVFFVNLSSEVFRPYSELWFSIIVLAGLLCFLVEGGGISSNDKDKKLATDV